MRLRPRKAPEVRVDAGVVVFLRNIVHARVVAPSEFPNAYTGECVVRAVEDW